MGRNSTEYNLLWNERRALVVGTGQKREVKDVRQDFVWQDTNELFLSEML
jgi:hypothetical protein